MQAPCWASLGDCKQSLSLVGHSSDLSELALGELRRTTGSLQAILFWKSALLRYDFITLFDRISIQSAVCYILRPALCLRGKQAIFMSQPLLVDEPLQRINPADALVISIGIVIQSQDQLGIMVMDAL